MVQVGETRQVIHFFPKSVVLKVGQPLIFGITAHSCEARLCLNPRPASVAAAAAAAADDVDDDVIVMEILSSAVTFNKHLQQMTDEPAVCSPVQ